MYRKNLKQQIPVKTFSKTKIRQRIITSRDIYNRHRTFKLITYIWLKNNSCTTHHITVKTFSKTEPRQRIITSRDIYGTYCHRTFQCITYIWRKNKSCTTSASQIIYTSKKILQELWCLRSLSHLLNLNATT